MLIKRRGARENWEDKVAASEAIAKAAAEEAEAELKPKEKKVAASKKPKRK